MQRVEGNHIHIGAYILKDTVHNNPFVCNTITTGVGGLSVVVPKTPGCVVCTFPIAVDVLTWRIHLHLFVMCEERHTNFTAMF